jgi:hypothetical protein
MPFSALRLSAAGASDRRHFARCRVAPFGMPENNRRMPCAAFSSGVQVDLSAPRNFM